MIDDLPYRVRNSIVTPTLTVRQPVDAQSIQYLADWIATRPHAAAAAICGPTWIDGGSTVIAVPGDTVNSPALVVTGGTSYPVEVYDGTPYVRRVSIGSDTRVVWPTGLEYGMVAVVANSNLVAGGSVQVIPLYKGTVTLPTTGSRTSQIPMQTFYWTAPSVALETVVPLALVQANPPQVGFPYGFFKSIYDMRHHPSGSFVMTASNWWLPPVEAFEPSSDALTWDAKNQSEGKAWLGLGNLRAQWVPYFDPSGTLDDWAAKNPGTKKSRQPLGVWLMVPTGFEVELTFSASCFRGNTAMFSPMVDGVSLADQGSGSQQVWESPTIQTGEDDKITDVTTGKPWYVPDWLRPISFRSMVPIPAPGIHFITVGVKANGWPPGGATFPIPDCQICNAQLRVRLLK